MPTTKDAVLAKLLKTDGYVSGERISTELGVSRAAVNTAVKMLKSDGHEIESSTNKGYRIISCGKKISAGEIMSYLEKNRTGGITVLDTVNSTNTYLRNLAAEGKAASGDCVIADGQTGGKGRLGRSFSSAKGKGIYFSYLINPKNAMPGKLSQITAWCAVAVRDAIAEVCGITPQIKWVNDLVYDSKKLCGILTEMSVVGESGEAFNVVIGIGINVNQDISDFPDELSGIAASLKSILGSEQNRAKLCARLIEKLDKLSEDFPKNKEYYLSQYRKSCAIIGKRSRIIRNDAERTGTVKAVDDDFGLVIDFDDGKCETVTGGEVSVRGFYGYI